MVGLLGIIDYHFAREAYELGLIVPHWVETINNGADIFTKSVPRQIMERLRPRETGYSDVALLAPILTLTPAEAAKMTDPALIAFAQSVNKEIDVRWRHSL